MLQVLMLWFFICKVSLVFFTNSYTRCPFSIIFNLWIFESTSGFPPPLTHLGVHVPPPPPPPPTYHSPLTLTFSNLTFQLQTTYQTNECFTSAWTTEIFWNLQCSNSYTIRKMKKAFSLHYKLHIFFILSISEKIFLFYKHHIPL